MKDNTIKKVFLNNVKLSGYKSIKNVDIDFKDGLNIIIGKNAAGKTNFFLFLDKSLSFNYGIVDFSTKLLFKSNKMLSILAKSEHNETRFGNDLLTTYDVLYDIDVDDKRIRTINKPNIPIQQELYKEGVDYSNIFVRHGVPVNYEVVDSSFNFIIENNRVSLELFSKMKNEKLPYFLRSFFIKISFAFLNVDKTKVLKDIEIKNIINNVFDELSSVFDNIVDYSPIQEVRLNKNFNIYYDEQKQYHTIDNLKFEYKIDGSWHPFSNLSDGTKRLFYVISEISCLYNHNSLGIRPKGTSKIILLEEPELGIHPHQLMELMKFIKEQSKTKQIIISTHSPLVLDILDKNDLDRIIIASMSPKKGTVLNHLSKDKEVKALKYMDEMYLSDYWKYSDLEN